MSRFFKYAILAGAVFAVFSPTLTGELITGDDEDLFNRLADRDSWNILDLFFRQGSGLYYRPLLALTYRADKIWWNLDPVIMHLENILLHLMNAVFVYLIVARFVPGERRKGSWLPLLAALLFCVHPITVESVAWISGRTDLLAAFFVLFSAWVLLLYKDRQDIALLFCAGILFAAGTVSKEVSVAFLPGALCLLFANWREQSEPSPHIQNKLNKAWITFWIMGIGAGFFLLRYLAYTKNSSKISLTLQFILNDPWNSLFVCFRAFGFYLKKVFWPFPLNFAILEVDPLYELAAIPVVLFCIYLLWRRSPVGSLFLAGAFLLTPSFLLAFNQIAWTPYAERYVYLPLAFIVSSLVVAGAGVFNKQNHKALASMAILLVIVCGSASYARSLTWQNNLMLWKDTTEKSPNSASAWNDYGVALAKHGDLKRALVAYQKAAAIHSLQYNPVYQLNIASVYQRLNNHSDAKQVYAEIYQKSDAHHKAALDGWLKSLEALHATVENEEDLNELLAEMQVVEGLRK